MATSRKHPYKAFGDELRKHIGHGERDSVAVDLQCSRQAVGHWLTGRSLPSSDVLDTFILKRNVSAVGAAALRAAWVSSTDGGAVFREALARAEAIAEGWQSYAAHFRRVADSVTGLTPREKALVATLRGADLAEPDNAPEGLLLLLLALDFENPAGPGAALIAAARAANDRRVDGPTSPVRVLADAVGAVARVFNAAAG